MNNYSISIKMEHYDKGKLSIERITNEEHSGETYEDARANCAVRYMKRFIKSDIDFEYNNAQETLTCHFEHLKTVYKFI